MAKQTFASNLWNLYYPDDADCVWVTCSACGTLGSWPFWGLYTGYFECGVCGMQLQIEGVSSNNFCTENISREVLSFHTAHFKISNWQRN